MKTARLRLAAAQDFAVNWELPVVVCNGSPN
jgi:hypothetical protein